VNYQNWYGLQDVRYGYGRHASGFIDHAPKTVRFDSKASVAVYFGLPRDNKGWWDGAWKSVFTMWETDELPSWFVRYLPLYDQIIVPCQHNLELFSKYHDNVSQVPEGVDRKIFYPRDTPRMDRFQFRAAGSLWKRKGLDVLVEVFNSLKLSDADLTIKAAPHAHDVPTQNLGDNIYLERRWMTEEEQCVWFSEADCFVAPARGEGWGLIPTQTISMGIPTIVSLSSGQLEFSHLATGVVSCRKSAAESIGRWDEPDRDELADQMLDHYNNWAAKKEQAMVNAEKMKEFSWPKAVKKLVSVLPQGELLDTDRWQPSFAYVTVKALKPVKADIGKAEIRQPKDAIFEVTDGQYQVLYDSGSVELV
jgi:glycosyltransferase involved in cell wall biosynthesis